jgi:hypothetical protein
MFIEKFESISAFSSAINSRPNNTVMKNSFSSKNGNESFTGTSSWEQAEKYLLYGWHEGLERAKQLASAEGLKISQNGEIERLKPYLHVTGYAPHVPNAILNVPLSMIKAERQPKKVKTLAIDFVLCVLANVKADDMLKAGLKLMKFILDTEMRGVRVNLNVVSGPESSGDVMFCKIKVKDYKNNLNYQKLAYILGNPSFFRRHMFKWIETMPYDKVPTGLAVGYGKVPEKKHLEKIKESDTILVDILDIIAKGDNYFKNLGGIQ